MPVLNVKHIMTGTRRNNSSLEASLLSRLLEWLGIYYADNWHEAKIKHLILLGLVILLGLFDRELSLSLSRNKL